MRFRKAPGADEASGGPASARLSEEMLAILSALQEGERFLVC